MSRETPGTTQPGPLDVVQLACAERLSLVERLRDLPTDDWARPSLCEGWTVHHVLAHLCTPFLVSVPRLSLEILRARGMDGAMDRVTRLLAVRGPAELLDVLERHAGSRFHPPGMPATTPYTDAVVHSIDIRWALGDPHTDTGDPARLVPVLDFLLSPRALAGFVARGRLRGLQLVATDVDWSHGAGERISGPALSLAAAILGRGPALDDLDGAGVARLAA